MLLTEMAMVERLGDMNLMNGLTGKNARKYVFH